MNPFDVIDVVRKLLSLILDLVPVDVVRAELDAAAVRRANAIADAAEALKFEGRQ